MSDLMNFFGQNGFATDSVEPQSDYEALPPGKYPIAIEKAEVRMTKAGDGNYIWLEMRVLDGKYKSRMVWDQINIVNPNAQCVQISLRTLAALGQAIGIPSITDTDQLLGQVCIAHVKTKDERNNVRTYSTLPVQGAPPLQQPAQPAQYAPQHPQAPVGQQPPPVQQQGAPVPPGQQPAQQQPAQQQGAQQQGAPVAGSPPWARP